jgi:hypothetical protein
MDTDMQPHVLVRIAAFLALIALIIMLMLGAPAVLEC